MLITHLVHGHKDDGDANEEVHGELVAEHDKGHDGGEDGGDGGAVLLQDGVSKLEEEAGQNPLVEAQASRPVSTLDFQAWIANYLSDVAARAVGL